ncbi:MAG: amino acid aminotransferase [Pseudomonadota bacterium]|nr:amino acid aminotransferase [Pseudomonadota bacterium]
MFEKLSLVPPDSILSLIAEYKNDDRADKIDLGVGVFRDSSGQTPIMSVIKEAEAYLIKNQKSKAYIGLAGDENFNSGMQNLMLGDSSLSDERLFTIQTAGGSNSLRMATELIKLSSRDITIWMSEPTWNNHLPILNSAGAQSKQYPYYNNIDNKLNFEGMIECLEGIPSGDVILLHACCHNPTGMDPTLNQWKEIVEVIVKRNLIPFIDCAYQGLANGLEEDAIAIRLMAESVDELIISSSCSKNFGLYRDRVGALTVLSKDADSSINARSNALRIARTMCSMPPDHGAAAVSYILSNDELYNKWIIELDAVRERLKGMRIQLQKALAERTDKVDFSHIVIANGMFSYLGVTPEQVQRLKEDYGIYMEGSGRINVAGITEANVSYFADSVASLF